MSRSMVIIGGGLGGLALALRAVSQGWQVTICERHASVGGKMNRVTIDGYHFDSGPSLITLPHIFHQLFEECGVQWQKRLRFHQLCPLTLYTFSDRTQIYFPNSLAQLSRELEVLEPDKGEGFWRLVGVGASLYELSQQTFFRFAPGELPSLSELTRVLKALPWLPLRYAWGNYAHVVQHFIDSTYLRRIFLRYPTYVGASPYRALSTLLIIPFLEIGFGGWYVSGGLYSIVQTIVDALAEKGATIYTNAHVKQIIVHKSRATGVILDTGDVITADVVVYNGDATTIDNLLGTSARRRGYERSMSGVVFLVGMRSKLRGVHHHTIAFSENYEVEFAEIVEHRRFPTSPTVYLNVASLTDPTLAPPGCETLFIMANAPAPGIDQWTPDIEEQTWERVLTTLDRCGVMIPESQIVVRDVWSPERFEHVYAMPGGSIYGPASHSYAGTFLRPRLRDRHIQGLYYVGGSTHPGGGTPMVVLSSKIVYRLIEKYEGHS